MDVSDWIVPLTALLMVGGLAWVIVGRLRMKVKGPKIEREREKSKDVERRTARLLAEVSVETRGKRRGEE